MTRRATASPSSSSSTSTRMMSTARWRMRWALDALAPRRGASWRTVYSGWATAMRSASLSSASTSVARIRRRASLPVRSAPAPPASPAAGSSRALTSSATGACPMPRRWPITRARLRGVSEPPAASSSESHREMIVARSATGAARRASWPQLGRTMSWPWMARPRWSGSSLPASTGPPARAHRPSTRRNPSSVPRTSLIRSTSFPSGVRRPRSARKFRTAPWRRARRAPSEPQCTARSVRRRGVWRSAMNSAAAVWTASASHMG